MDLRGKQGHSGGMTSELFAGAKIALICGQRLVAYKRDDKPGIPFPGQWDLPGGGREGAETPQACALREVHEEFGIQVAAETICWCRRYPSVTAPGLVTWFLAAPLSEAQVAAIRFGDEGQYWELMTFGDFLTHPEAIPHLQARLADYFAAPPQAR